MMVVFQNKIIYMPSIPPFSRSEKLEDYANQCRPVVWREHDLQAADGVALKLLEGKVAFDRAVNCEKHVVVLYFQGNASSLPPRLPHLSPVLKALQASDGHIHKRRTAYTIFALSYRGFWTSRGRATQPGIELDAQAALSWLSQTMVSKPANPGNTKLVLWGQSIGAGVATTALASLLSQQSSHRRPDPQQHPLEIHSLILETPFLSIRSMLVALYPQKFLPYRYLWPFLRSTWDSEAAVHSIARSKIIQRRQQMPKKVLILQAGKDEVVPAEQSEALERICKENLDGLHVGRVMIEGALHTEILAKSKGRAAVVQHLRRAAEDD
jgi:uncharacterized protein